MSPDDGIGLAGSMPLLIYLERKASSETVSNNVKHAVAEIA